MDSTGNSVTGEWTVRGQSARAALEETWTSVAGVGADLGPGEWAHPTACPGWSVQDQISHLIGIERMLLGEAAPEWDEPLGDHVKNDFAASLEPWVAVRRARPPRDVLAEFGAVTAQRLAALAVLDEAAWAKVGFSPMGEVPYADFMDLRVFDCWVHEQDVRAAVGRPGGTGGRASGLAAARVQGAMGFVVGKKAGAPEGSVVRFVIEGTGDDAREFALAITGGRAAAVGDEVAATATLSMSSLHFVRLGCGRVTVDDVEAAGGIRFDGDDGLGRAVAGSMNFMI